MDKRNVAYDLSLFEERPRQEKVNENIVRIPKQKNNVKTKKRASAVVVLYTSLISVAVISVLGVIIYSQVQLTEVTEQLNVANKTLSESQSTYTQLQMRAESKLSFRTVEKYATDELSMKKLDPSQIEYIGLSNGDKAEMKTNSSSDNIFDKIKGLFS